MAVTYLSGQRIQGLSSDTKPTDVPVGSEFEQTDDYKTYQRGSNSVGSDWTTTGVVSESGGVVSFTMDTTDDIGSAYKIISTAGSTWNLRYKLTITTDDISGTHHHVLLTGVTDLAVSTGFEDPPTSSKSVYVKHAFHADNAAQYWTNGTTNGNDWGNGVTIVGGAVTYYIEIVNNAGSMQTRYTTSSDYTGGSTTSAWTVNATANGGTKNKVFFVACTANVASGSVVGTASDFVFTNNSITSATDSWVERGTAI
tara:strand:- start:4125 stop:4889 length:765 start_codon:yes stop_codon:yes gene_type:complete